MPEKVVQRVVIFADCQIAWVPTILETFLEALEQRPDLCCVGVVTTSPCESGFQATVKSVMAYIVKLAFNFGQRRQFALPRTKTVLSVASKFSVEIIRPPEYRINDKAFVNSLQERHQATLALSLGCLQIWKAPLLRTMKLAVNYHNGYLPHYKGLLATHWSLYRGEPWSGYAFHVMDEEIDTGPVICRGKVAVYENDAPASLERRKLTAALGETDKVLDAMSSGSVNTDIPSESGSYFSEAAGRKMWIVDHPDQLTKEEIFRRLRCFGTIRMRINDEYFPVTSMKPVLGEQYPLLSVLTADGARLQANRLQYCPAKLYLAATRGRWW